MRIRRRRRGPRLTESQPAGRQFFVAAVLTLILSGWAVTTRSTALLAGAPEEAAAGTDQAAVLPERYALAEVWTGETRSLYHPAGLDWDTSGIVWVAEQGAHRVRNFRSNGDVAFGWPGQPQPSGEPGAFRSPQDIAVDVTRELVYVADTGNERVQVLARRTGAFVAEWTDVGVPKGIALSDDGAVIAVTDGASHSVRVFAPDGAPIRQIGGFGRDAGQFDTPLGVDVDTDGTIYVADSGNRRVQWLDPEGRPLGSLLLDGSIGPAGVPLDVAIDDDQTMFVAVARGVLRFRFRTQYAEQLAPGDDAGAGVDPESIPQNHEGVSGVAVRPGVGLAFSYAPALGSPDRVMLFPERWFPSLIAGSAGPRSMDDPYRVDGSGTLAVVRDSTRDLRIFLAGGGWYDPFGTYVGGEGTDVAAVHTGTPCIPMCTPLGAVTLNGNEARMAWLSCFANCAVPPAYEILSEAMRLRQDCRGFDREADDLWWNRAVSASSADEHAVLDAGRGTVTVRRRDPLVPVGEPGWMILQGGIRLERSQGFRAFADVDHDTGGNLYVLARDGGILRYDGRGRGLGALDLDLPGGRTGEALAVGAAGEVFVLTNDQFVLKYDGSARLRAAWSVSELGGPGAYTDVAIGPDGKILVPDADHDRILAFAPTEGTSEVPEAGHDLCELVPSKSASPSRLQLGETTEVALDLAASCPGDALDLVIVIETDCGMSGDRLRYLREAAAGFAGGLEGDRQVAVVTFGPEIDAELGGARLFQPFTSDRSVLAQALAAVNTTCLPFIESRPVDLADGLALARETLSGPAARAGAAKAVVVIAPGRSRREVVMWEARRLWLDGASVYTLALGQDRYCAGLPPDEGLLAAMAVPVSGARRVEEPELLPEAMAALADELSGATGLDQITVIDRIPANMRLVNGSVDPPAQVQPDGSLAWTVDATRGTSWRMRFLLEPLAVGIWPTNLEAVANPEGPRAGRAVTFPVPTVEVWIPEPTPTPLPPSATPTASPTASPDRPTSTPLRPPTITPQPSATRLVAQRHALYLPQVYASEGCVPSTRPVDVALVVDTSSSMTPDKMALARSAASGFVDLLALPRDRGAIVSFDAEARTLQSLTTDRAALHRALDSLDTGVGTRIDLGLGEGLTAVAGVDARTGADPVLVLLTDGRPDGGTHQQVLTMAELARDLGVVVYTIGLGQDVDALLLQEVAGQPDRYFPAPTAADLARIYSAVAKLIPCR